MMRNRGWVTLLAVAAVIAPARAAGQQPDSAATEAPQAQALRRQIRLRWNQHVTETLGLTDAQAAKVQATEDRYEQQRMGYRAQLREINRGLNGEMLAEKPDNDRINQLIRQRQDLRLRLDQVDRDEDQEMAGYLSPRQRVRYQQERAWLRERVAEFVRQRAQRPGGGLGPAPGRPRPGGRPGRRPPP